MLVVPVVPEVVFCALPCGCEAFVSPRAVPPAVTLGVRAKNYSCLLQPHCKRQGCDALCCVALRCVAFRFVAIQYVLVSRRLRKHAACPERERKREEKPPSYLSSRCQRLVKQRCVVWHNVTENDASSTNIQ